MMRVRTLGRLVIASLTIATAARAQRGVEPRSADLRALDSTIASIVRDQHVPGLAVGVVRGGRVVFSRGYGVRQLGGSAPITTRSLFHMASVTKPFVATAIMQLVEKNAVSLDSPVVRYVPYFKVRDSSSAHITIRQMLTHSSGMRDVTDYRWDHPEFDDASLERYVRGLADSTLLWPPGSKFRYSNIAFEVLADVIAKVTHMPFEDYMQQRILAPVGMRSSTLMKPRADTSLLTTGHVVDKAGTASVSAHFPYNRPHAASSTLLSNVDDMTRWVLVNLHKGDIEGTRILAASSYDLLWHPEVATGAPVGSISGDHVGLSWFLGAAQGHRLITHGGGDTGFLSFVVIAPDDDAGFVMMTNSEKRAIRNAADEVLKVLFAH